MKRLKPIGILLLSCSILATSCATILGGPITASQKHRPEKGEAKRKLRPAPLIAGIVTIPFFVGAISLIVDFSTRAIYKPMEPKSK